MALFLVTFFIMALAVGGMAIGVIFGRSPIAGSCGGLNALDGSGACQTCSRPCKSRRRANQQSRLSAEEQPLIRSRLQSHMQPPFSNTSDGQPGDL